MKITKRQLRRIIKEEKSKLVNEVYAANSTIQDEIAKIDDAVDMMYELGSSIEEIQQELRALADELPNMDLGSHKTLDTGWDEADQDHANLQYVAQHGDPYNEGTSIEQMPAAWRQILGNSLKEKK